MSYEEARQLDMGSEYKEHEVGEEGNVPGIEPGQGAV